MQQNEYDFNWPLINDNITEEDKQELIDFIKTKDVRFTNGKKVKHFEELWSKWLDVKYSTFVNSGASANYIMISIVKELYGTGEVIVPPIGWVSDIASIVNLGMTPVFVDVELNNFSTNLEHIKTAVTNETKAIVLIHAMGFNAIDDEIVNFAKQRNIILIEDCCESHGASYNGKKIGTFGDMSNFSFYFGHHMTTIEGGMICTNDEKVHNLARLYRSHGMTREGSEQTKKEYKEKYPELNPLFTFAVPGYNMRNTEINAVIGISQIKRLDNNISIRQKNLAYWIEALDESRFFVDFSQEESSNFALPLILKEADKELLHRVCEELEANKVEYRLGTAGGGNQAIQPYLVEGKNFYRIAEPLKNSNHIHRYGLYIGNHIDLTKEQIVNLCQRINNV